MLSQAKQLPLARESLRVCLAATLSSAGAGLPPYNNKISAGGASTTATIDVVAHPVPCTTVTLPQLPCPQAA